MTKVSRGGSASIAAQADAYLEREQDLDDVVQAGLSANTNNATQNLGTTQEARAHQSQTTGPISASRRVPTKGMSQSEKDAIEQANQVEMSVAQREEARRAAKATHHSWINPNLALHPDGTQAGPIDLVQRKPKDRFQVE